MLLRYAHTSSLKSRAHVQENTHNTHRIGGVDSFFPAVLGMFASKIQLQNVFVNENTRNNRINDEMELNLCMRNMVASDEQLAAATEKVECGTRIDAGLFAASNPDSFSAAFSTWMLCVVCWVLCGFSSRHANRCVCSKHLITTRVLSSHDAN